MKRTALTLTLALFFGFIGMAWSQVPAQRVIIVDPTGMHAASVSGGNLGTAGSASVTVDTITHITSATHVVVHTVGGVNVADSANTALRVNCVTGCSASSSTHTAVSQTAAAWTIAHISSVLHVNVRDLPRQAHLAAAQSGVWNVTAHQGGAWNVSAAQSGAFVVTAAHIIGGSGHLAVTMADHFTVRIPGHVAITQGAAALQVDCSNCSAASVVAVSHISAAVHVAAIAQPVHVVGVSVVNAVHPLTCHSSMAFHTSARATTIAHANSGMKIYICGLLVLSQAADNISIVEGQGTACATGRQELIGHTTAALSLPATGGFSTIHPFPWINSKVTGNAVCLIKGNALQHVSGVITYRGSD